MSRLPPTACLVLSLALLAGCATRPPAQSPGGQPLPPPQTPPQARCTLAEPPAGPGTVNLKVFFSCDEQTKPITRQVPAGVEPVRASLEELLKGPTAQERAAGFTSFFIPATAGMVKSVAITEFGRAIVDFADFSTTIPNASSSTGSAELMSQLKSTVFQIKGVKEAEFRFEGSCERFWNWLQFDCQIVKP